MHEMKNILDGINSRLNITEEKNSEFKNNNRSYLFETHTKRIFKKMNKSSVSWDNFK